MKKEIACEQARLPRNPVVRRRSVPHRGPFVLAVALSLLHLMCVTAAITALVLFIDQPSQLGSRVFVACLGVSGFTWLLAFFKRRRTHCPVCKGTPLINGGALVHQKAYRIFPLNHGTTASLAVMATQKFRCMYCGTDFDLLKTPTHKRTKGEPKRQAEYTTYTSDEDPS
jgi:hypothetical protein